MCYVILSDIHANYAALQAINAATQRMATTKKFYFLGDLLGYGPTQQALKCLDWLHFESHIYQDNDGGPENIRWIPGNHDEWAVKRMGRVRDEGAVTLLAQSQALKSGRAADWDWFADEVNKALKAEHRTWLTEVRGEEKVDLLMAFTHGGAYPPERRGTYLWPWQHSVLRNHFEPIRVLSDESGAEIGTKILFCGHSHLPFLARILPDEGHPIVFRSIRYGQSITLEPGEYLINPGSAGHPRDGDPRAAFVMFEPSDRTVVFHRVEYDTRSVIDELKIEQGTAHQQHKVAAHYLLRLDLGDFKVKRAQLEKDPVEKPPKLDKPGQRILWEALACGQDVNPDNPSRELRQAYMGRVEKAYEHLTREIKTGCGGEHEQRYHAEVYRSPLWDLEAIPSQQV